jgi:hypothetical protein
MVRVMEDLTDIPEWWKKVESKVALLDNMITNWILHIKDPLSQCGRFFLYRPFILGNSSMFSQSHYRLLCRLFPLGSSLKAASEERRHGRKRHLASKRTKKISLLYTPGNTLVADGLMKPLAKGKHAQLL